MCIHFSEKNIPKIFLRSFENVAPFGIGLFFSESSTATDVVSVKYGKEND